MRGQKEHYGVLETRKGTSFAVVQSRTFKMSFFRRAAGIPLPRDGRQLFMRAFFATKNSEDGEEEEEDDFEFGILDANRTSNVNLPSLSGETKVRECANAYRHR